MKTTQLATFHTREPVELEDGEKLVVEREGEELVARRVPAFDSDEPIVGTPAFLASVREFATRIRHDR